jgi:hypothetical protein
VGFTRRVSLPSLWAILVMAVVLLLDQLSKAAVRNSIVPGETRSVSTHAIRGSPSASSRAATSR